jgi:catechol 2,3-dioxygenase-like lactoylglutathione lyase family enzyme
VPFSHVALATRDLPATHRFYSETLGLALVHVDVGDLPSGRWFRHAFYDAGAGELLAFFDLHDDEISEYDTAISTGLGLPSWVNHVALQADSLDDIETRRQRLLAHGYDCVVADHGVAVSLYVEDPNGITIEFAHAVEEVVTEENRRHAVARIAEERPASTGVEPVMEFFAAEHTPALR